MIFFFCATESEVLVTGVPGQRRIHLNIRIVLIFILIESKCILEVNR